jgi:integrase
MPTTRAKIKAPTDHPTTPAHEAETARAKLAQIPAGRGITTYEDRPPLSEKFCEKEAAPPTDGKLYTIFRDGKDGKGRWLPGFGLLVTRGGHKSFVLSYRTKSGTSRRYTIGTFGEWSVAAARKRASELSRKVADGEDPVAEERAIRAAPTVRGLCEEYLASGDYSNLRKHTKYGYARTIKAEVIPAIGTAKPDQITIDDAQRLHRKISKRAPVVANRVVQFCSTLWNWKRIIPNPWVEVTRNEERASERFLNQDEINRFRAAIDAFPDQHVADIFRVMIYTGSRPDETLKARWSDVDLDAKAWRKPSTATKQKKLHVVDLTPPVLELFRRIKAKTGHQEWVFPGCRKGRPRYDIDHVWEKIREQCRFPKDGPDRVRLYDACRHTFGSICSGAGMSLTAIGALMGHNSERTTRRYAHFSDEARKAAAQRAAIEIQRRLQGGAS